LYYKTAMMIKIALMLDTAFQYVTLLVRIFGRPVSRACRYTCPKYR
jgi:hypothetical protein